MTEPAKKPLAQIFGDNVRRYREAEGLSIEALSARTEKIAAENQGLDGHKVRVIKPQELLKLESGEREPTSGTTINTLALALGIEFSQLFIEHPEHPEQPEHPAPAGVA